MKTYLKLIALLVLPLVMAAGWYLFAQETGREQTLLASIDFSSLLLPSSPPDTLFQAAEQEPQKEVDTTAQRILFFGDSMVEGLKEPMADYAAAKHELTSVVWYSSGTRLWAQTDTLQHFLREVQPTYVFVCLGSNQLFVRNLGEVDNEIRRIVEKIGDIPFVWISPPNWKDDTGINELIIKHVGRDRYFDSRHLTLARRKDHAHPTPSAACQWCDTICSWLSTLEPRHPLRLVKPLGKPHRTARTVLLQPVQ